MECSGMYGIMVQTNEAVLPTISQRGCYVYLLDVSWWAHGSVLSANVCVGFAKSVISNFDGIAHRDRVRHSVVFYSDFPSIPQSLSHHPGLLSFHSIVNRKTALLLFSIFGGIPSCYHEIHTPKIQRIGDTFFRGYPDNDVTTFLLEKETNKECGNVLKKEKREARCEKKARAPVHTQSRVKLEYTSKEGNGNEILNRGPHSRTFHNTQIGIARNPESGCGGWRQWKSLTDRIKRQTELSVH